MVRSKNLLPYQKMPCHTQTTDCSVHCMLNLLCIKKGILVTEICLSSNGSTWGMVVRMAPNGGACDESPVFCRATATS